MTTETFSMADLQPEPIATTPDDRVPHFRPSGETGDAAPAIRKERPGIFAGRGNRAAPKLSAAPRKRPKDTPPKLAPGHRQKIADFYRVVGAGIRPFDELLGETIVDQADACAKSVYDFAQENDAVRRAILAFTTVSAGGALLFAHLPILLVAIRHTKNEQLRTGAATTMVMLKFMESQEANQAFEEKDTEDGE